MHFIRGHRQNNPCPQFQGYLGEWRHDPQAIKILNAHREHPP